MRHYLTAIISGLALICGLCLLAPAYAAPVNLLDNGNFAKTTPIAQLSVNLTNQLNGFKTNNTVLGDAVPDGWYYETHGGKTTIGLTGDVKHGTSPALKISNGTTGDIGVVRSANDLTLKPNTRYLLSYYVKGENIQGGMGALAFVNYQKGAERTSFWAPGLSGTFDWQRVEVGFVSDENANPFKFGIQLRQASGVAWFSDVTLIETNNLVVNGGFEGWAPVKNPAKGLTIPDGGPIGYWLGQSAYEANPVVKGTIARDTQVKHSGDCAVRIENGLPTDIVDVTVPPEMLRILPNYSYTVRVWVKGKDIVKNTKDGAGVMIWASTGPKDYWSKTTHVPFLPKTNDGTFDWMPVEFRVDTNADAVLMKMTVQLRRASGTAWFDDLELIPIGPIPKVEAL